MLNYTVDFLAGMTSELMQKENNPPLSQYNSGLDRSTGSTDSIKSESSCQSTDSILHLEKKAPIIATGSKSEKPTHSYIALISKAILSSNDNKMVLGDMYEYIMKAYPYYNNQEKAWRNSIRHNLSINECFFKNGRSDNGTVNFWSIHPACVEDFSKGDFRRRQARRRAKKGAKGISSSYQPVNYGNPVYTPMTSSYMGYQPMTSSSVGFQSMISSQLYQRGTSSSAGYQSMATTAASNFPLLTTIPGYQSTSTVSRSYHPYHRSVASREGNTQTRHNNKTSTTTIYPSPIQMSPVDRFPFTLANLLNSNGENYSSSDFDL